MEKLHFKGCSADPRQKQPLKFEVLDRVLCNNERGSCEWEEAVVTKV